MLDYCIIGRPKLIFDGCHFVTLEEFFYRAKSNMAAIYNDKFGTFYSHIEYCAVKKIPQGCQSGTLWNIDLDTKNY